MLKLVRSIVKKTMQTVGAGNINSARVLLKIFFQEIRSASVNLKELSAKKEYKNLAMVAHKMAGACAYFGAGHLYLQLLKIESLAKKPVVGEDFFAILEKTAQLLDEAGRLERSVFELLDRRVDSLKKVTKK